MPAWEIKNRWNSVYVAAYRDCVANNAEIIYARREILDCADLCLKILIDFAEKRNLPLMIEGKSGSHDTYTAFNPKDSQWQNSSAFKLAIMDGIEVREIFGDRARYEDYGNTYKIPVDNLQSGDMLVQRSSANIGARVGIWGHLQLVARSTLKSPTSQGVPISGEAVIYQGNLKGVFFGLFGSEPTEVQKGNYYFKRADLKYKREGQSEEQNGAELWRKKEITAIRWNFAQFNDGVYQAPKEF